MARPVAKTSLPPPPLPPGAISPPCSCSAPGTLLYLALISYQPSDLPAWVPFQPVHSRAAMPPGSTSSDPSARLSPGCTFFSGRRGLVSRRGAAAGIRGGQTCSLPGARVARRLAWAGAVRALRRLPRAVAAMVPALERGFQRPRLRRAGRPMVHRHPATARVCCARCSARRDRPCS